MDGGHSLGRRLAGYEGFGSGLGMQRSAFDHVHMRGLRPRIDALLDDTVWRFELDRLIYDLEVEAQHRWLRNLMAFDAYCARRDRDAQRRCNS